MTLQVFENLSAMALESVRSAILIAEATDPDFPIAYMNPAFETLTGYAPREVLGKNCRFLQGTDRNQESRHGLREALSSKHPAHAILRNYRKDGSLFYNEFFIEPIFGPNGAVTHFVGCQNAIASPRAAGLRQQAQSRFERLTDREREVFERIANGCSNKVIGHDLGISVRTAEKHRISVFKKMGVSDLTLLVRYAIALNIPLQDPR